MMALEKFISNSTEHFSSSEGEADADSDASGDEKSAYLEDDESVSSNSKRQHPQPQGGTPSPKRSHTGTADDTSSPSRLSLNGQSHDHSDPPSMTDSLAPATGVGGSHSATCPLIPPQLPLPSQCQETAQDENREPNVGAGCCAPEQLQSVSQSARNSPPPFAGSKEFSISHYNQTGPLHGPENPISTTEQEHGSTSNQPQQKAHAENVSKKPLKSFSFTNFLPADIPQEILKSRDTRLKMLKNAVDVQTHMWQYNHKLTEIDLGFPTNYATDLQSDHALLCGLADVAFHGLSRNGVHFSKKVCLPSIHLDHIDVEWKRMLKVMEIKVEEVSVPLIGSKEEVVNKLPTLIVALKTCANQEIKFEPLKDLPKLDLKKTKKNLQDLQLPPTLAVYYGRQCIHGKRAKDKQEKSPVAAAGSKAPKPACKRKGSQPNVPVIVCTSDVVIEHNLLGIKRPMSPYHYWGLENIHKHYKGNGTVIAVIDTGVNIIHPCLLRYWDAHDPKVIAVRDFVNETPICTVDKNGHGTLCAGIACGGTFVGYTDDGQYGTIPDGVAPEAKLISCKVTLDDSDKAEADVVAEALSWLKGEEVDVVSISLGSLAFSKKMANEIADLVKNDVIVVCAASNHGHKFRQPICYPAALGNVLCIGSHDAHGKPSQFSPVGQQIHFLAPGESVLGPDSKNYSHALAADGTSCAAPAVAGLICLIIECIQKNFPDEHIRREMHNHWIVKEILREMSTNSGNHGDDRGYGALNPEPFFADPCCTLKNALRESHPDLYRKISKNKK